MRMAGPDIVLFVVGALLFGGATAAIVTTPGGLDAIRGVASPLGVYTVAYTTTTVEGQEATVGDFSAAQPVAFDVNNTRVSRVTVVVSCADPVPAGSTFTITVSVAGPNGTAGEGSGACGQTLEVPVEVTPVPSSTTVSGSTPEAAAANVPHPNATSAMGTWTVTLGGSRGAPVGLPGPTNPGGSVLLRVETWDATLTPVAK